MSMYDKSDSGNFFMRSLTTHSYHWKNFESCILFTAVFIKVAASTLYLGHVTRSKIALRSCDTAFRSCD